MELAKLTVIALVLAARTTCRGEIDIGTSTPDESTASLVDDLVNIVTSCYAGQINHGVGLAGNLPSTLMRRLTVQHSIPVALIDNVWNFKDNVRPADVQFRRKLNVFIIEAASVEKLQTLIEMNIGKSIWWNHMASFFILDLSPGCVNAVRFLGRAWMSDLLNAKLMCSDHNHRKIIFNYNPFTGQAPVSWQRVNFPWFVKKETRGEFLQLTIFSRNYRVNASVCVDLDFDKTRDLGGYTIRLQGDHHEHIPIDRIVGRAESAYFSTNERILATVFLTLNATAKTYYDGDFHMTYGECRFFVTWKIDGFMGTYPHRQAEDRIITQFRGYKSQLNKVVDVFDIGSWFGMLIVYLITLIFFKFFVRQTLVPALLNLLRMTCGMGFSNLSDNTASRIYLASLFLFAVAMQGVFQSDTAFLLTSQITLPHAQSIEDLQDLGYKQIYAVPSKRYMFEGLDVEKKFYGNWDRRYRLMRVKNDSSVATIDETEGYVLDFVQKFDLRVSTNSIQNHYAVFAIQWNYPLTERINKIMARMVEASVLEPWAVKCSPTKLSDFYVDSTDKNNLEFTILNLHDMAFAFAVLGIGLSCATLVFIIELAVGYYKAKYTCRIETSLIPATRRDSIPTITEL